MLIPQSPDKPGGKMTIFPREGLPALACLCLPLQNPYRQTEGQKMPPAGRRTPQTDRVRSQKEKRLSQRYVKEQMANIIVHRVDFSSWC
jgi:hypothetical protein